MRQASIYRSPISQEQRDQVKAYFEQHGINVADWARERNLAPRHLYDLLNGKTAGVRGESRRAAIFCGLREDIIEERAAS